MVTAVIGKRRCGVVVSCTMETTRKSTVFGVGGRSVRAVRDGLSGTSRRGRALFRWLAVLWFMCGAAVPALACPKTYIDSYRFDFLDPSKAWNVNDLNTNHCDANVRSLKGSARHGVRHQIMNDIDFTLAHMPNHHPCLMAVVRYQAKKGYPFFPAERRFPSAECYLRNAQYLFPDDFFLWSLLGVNHYHQGKYDAAVKAFLTVLEKQPRNAEVLYNLGLTYFAQKDYTKSEEAARKAYQLGFPLPGLKRKLRAVGAWSDDAS